MACENISSRKSIEWADVRKDAKGNRTIRYKYYAIIWEKDTYIMNQVFTFDAKGNILDMQNVEGFPQKKVEKPVNVSTQQGMKELVEDFFSKNFRDITARETMEWGEITKLENGNRSIRYKYRAKIWDKDIKIMDQVFTFDPKGKFVSVWDAEKSAVTAIAPFSTIKSFRDGDSITITEVKATSPDLKAGDKVIVKGHYTLSSKPKASLCLFLTASTGSGAGPIHPEQQLNIAKGEGEFELSETLEGDGHLHVTFYSVPDGKDFGGMYFGTAKQMKEIEHWHVENWYGGLPSAK